MDNIRTKKIFIKRYSDDRIFNKDRLWDNIYGYDNTIKSARRNGVEIVQDIEKYSFQFNLFNHENEYENGKLKPVWDDNVNSILTLINVNNKKTFFGGDLDNTDNRENKYGSIIGEVDAMKFNHHVYTDISNSKNFIEKLSSKIMYKTSGFDVEKNYMEYLKQKGISVVDLCRQDLTTCI